ncbi:ferredoxin [Streptomyces sp. TG1A-8]|uniref:ferredoxin n=1 Tax=Streptomyces sp. TG1A-8 TaxID=3051385 RepID=UPI00265C39D7|nr:ferredoxin [Streptomyces sp. TG1A-8]MDO0924375.1 ferredoxin [Streptomyces sp. TG1A-8]
MDIAIDHGRCIGAGQCALIAPQVFDQRIEDGLAVLLVERPDDSQREAVREASESCPLGAISVREDPPARG